MKPLVALTFDDGPSEWTPPLLDVLQANHAHATFFVLGCNIAGRENVLWRIVDEGHELAVHGWDHTRTSDLPLPELQNRIVQTVAALAGFVPRGLHWWRPPWNEATDEQTAAVREFGLALCRPTVDGYDVSREERAIVRTLLTQVAAGAVVGLHDGIAENGEKAVGTRWPTIRATEKILHHCRSVTVSELLG